MNTNTIQKTTEKLNLTDKVQLNDTKLINESSTATEVPLQVSISPVMQAQKSSPR